MLDHDELLPTEQANLGLVQKLREIYQMDQEEQRVLNRVHERLAQNADPLPLPEPVQATGSTRSRDILQPVAAPSLFGRRWQRRLSVLAAVICVGILVGALALTLTGINHTTVGSEPNIGAIHIVLVPVGGGHTPSQAAMETASNILSERLASFGLPGGNVHVTTTHGQPGILIELPRLNGNEQQMLGTLLETGTLAFWDTGNIPPMVGTSFNPSQYARYNRGDRPLFTGQDLNANDLAITTDQQTGQMVIDCMMKGSAIDRFATFTQAHIGDYLTITLDGNVISSANIQSEINGPFIIAGNFTQQQANAILAVLKYGILPVALKQLS